MDGSDSMVSEEFVIAGMDCAACGASVERAVRAIDGVDDVMVDVFGARARVRHHGGVDRMQITDAIGRAGYQAAHDARDGLPPCTDPSGIERPSRTAVPPGLFAAHRRRLTLAVAAGCLLALGMVSNWFDAPAFYGLTLLALSTVAGGWFVIPRGLRAARNRALDMTFLMSIAALGAWLIGEPTEAAATLFLFAVAELLESYSLDRARDAIKALMQVAPAEASVLRDGVERRVPIADVAVGETVVVRPGERISVDGRVVLGWSSVNQAPITGESMPVDKAVGSDVLAGSLNGHGLLQVCSTKPASDTTIARIVHAVAEAQSSRAPTERFVDRFARIYTPTVVGIAALLAVAPPLLGLGTWSEWIYRALAMLVVACPCALVISTPVTIVSGLAGAARGGVLIKGGVHLENLARVSVICIDKTGTLTEGKPMLSVIVALDGSDEAEVLSFALGVEQYSEHPLARAVMQEGNARGVVAPDARDFIALPGRGARAMIGGELVEIGNQRLLDELPATVQTATARRALEELERDGMTAVAVVVRERVIGLLGIADRVRDNAPAALQLLRDSGVGRIVMLTGDHDVAARAVASRVGVDESYAQLLPADKVRVVRDFQRSGQQVAFVGDGVNDTPALAAASVGIAMGAAGTAAALETADVALMADDLEKLAFAVRLARRTLAIIKQNLALSLAIKAIFLVLAVSGKATLWMAVAADMGGSLLVVANGLRARQINASIYRRGRTAEK